MDALRGWAPAVRVSRSGGGQSRPGPAPHPDTLVAGCLLETPTEGCLYPMHLKQTFPPPPASHSLVSQRPESLHLSLPLLQPPRPPPPPHPPAAKPLPGHLPVLLLLPPALLAAPPPSPHCRFCLWQKKVTPPCAQTAGSQACGEGGICDISGRKETTPVEL